MNHGKRYLRGLEGSLIDKLRVLEHVPENAERVLDVGCASGIVTDYMGASRHDTLFLGIDIDPMYVQMARARRDSDNVGFEHTRLRDLLLSGAKFDAITFISVLHEFASYGEGRSSIVKAMCDAHEMLSPGGTIVIRDMMYSPQNIEFEQERRNRIVNNVVGRVNGKTDYDGWYFYSTFSDAWGAAEDSMEQLNHFLLKLQFPHIWEVEVQENYFPFAPGGYDALMVGLLGMTPINREVYLLDYIRDSHMRGHLGMSVGDTSPFTSTGLLAYRKE